MLSDPQIERYSRQILLPRVGGRGQERLLAARVALLGDGTIARTAATYLAAAGVGHLDLHFRDGTAPAWLAVNPNPSDCRATVAPAAAAANDTDLVLHAGAPRDVGTGGGDIRHRIVATASAQGAAVVDAGLSCAACAVRLADGEDGPASRAFAASVAEPVAGSLLALEAIAVLLDPATAPGRRTRLAPGTDVVETTQLDPATLCAHADARTT